MMQDSFSRKSRLDLTEIDIFGILSALDEGIIITDIKGRILFYNDTQARIDELTPEKVIGRRVTAIYRLSERESMIMKCLETGQPIRNHLFFYRTHLGKEANTIHSVFPLYRNGVIVGAICFVKDYNMLEHTITASSDLTPHKIPLLENGTRYKFSDIVGKDETFMRVLKIIRLSSDSPSPVMLYGETGTGKELFAQSIHNASSRHERPFVGINCAAIPENLLEALLFGTARGAFTGAMDKAGIFEQSSGGTLFLDEINSMPVNLQAKLLRALQEMRVRRIGAANDIEIDLKIISSVNIDPHQAIKEGRLRMDLFYRLGVVFVRIPPLRERKDGIESLTRHFIYKNNLALNKQVKGVSDEVMAFFQSYQWPGNVRELEHIIEGTMNMIGVSQTIESHHLPIHFIHPDFRRLSTENDVPSCSVPLHPAAEVDRFSPSTARAGFPPVSGSLPETQKSQERDMVSQALLNSKGNVSRAARSLGISRQLLHYKMKKYAIDRKQFTE
ncbi:MAG: sigma 54-interacting transcriptional regulator [Desulfococcus multivorans]|jgi:arginine utilization regulatory protein|nr:sigma 54-interacting transcriptional regulator [Desulfococcus multivorans]